jgi:O-acetyl-ADP-ribose deacetylase (regulator of RNase III)
MIITVKRGDICDEKADVIVSTANPWLNMSGGVNGEILQRGGESIQEELHSYLKNSGSSVVEPGAIVKTNPGPLSCLYILHAVAVNTFYESSVEILKYLLQQIITGVHADGLRTVAVPSMGTGYGKLEISDFAQAIRDCALESDDRLGELRVVLYSEDDFEAFRPGMSEN